MTQKRDLSANFVNIFNTKESMMLLPKATFTFSEMECIVEYFFEKNKQLNPVIKQVIDLIDEMKDFWVESDPGFAGLYENADAAYDSFFNNMQAIIDKNKIFLATLTTPSLEKNILEDAIKYCEEGIAKRQAEIFKSQQENIKK